MIRAYIFTNGSSWYIEHHENEPTPPDGWSVAPYTTPIQIYGRI